MFARERAFELGDECRNFIRDVAEFFQVLAAMQIQHGPDVQKSGRRVAIK